MEHQKLLIRLRRIKGVAERPKVTTTTVVAWCQGGTQGPVESTTTREAREVWEPTTSPAGATPEPSPAAALGAQRGAIQGALATCTTQSKL
jgi:hypothetical protein